MWHGKAFGHICPCVCLAVCNTIIVESFLLESLFLASMYVLRQYGPGSYVKVIISSLRSHEQKD